MTPEQQYLMYLYSCGAVGAHAKAPEAELDWQTLFRLAEEQTVAHTLAMALKNAPEIEPPGELRAAAMAALLGTAIKTRLKTTAILALLGRMEKAGLHAVVLKGCDVARLYANPECRISADTDLLISPADERRALDFLAAEGFEVTERGKATHHSVCRHPTLGLFEVHVSLWEDAFDDVVFDRIGLKEAGREAHRLVAAEGGEYYALGSSDALLFLTLHMMKHFVVTGLGLRMMMDVALYFKSVAGEVDPEWFWGVLRSLRLENTLNCILGAMIEHCGFEKKDFPGMGAYSREDIETVLADMFKGGWQGEHDKDSRREGWYYYRREKKLSGLGRFRYFFYIRRIIFMDRLRAVFLPRERLALKYPQLEGQPWKYPFLIVKRILTDGLRRLFSKNRKSRQNISDEASLAPQGRERIKMLRQLGIL